MCLVHCIAEYWWTWMKVALLYKHSDSASMPGWNSFYFIFSDDARKFQHLRCAKSHSHTQWIKCKKIMQQIKLPECCKRETVPSFRHDRAVLGKWRNEINWSDWLVAWLMGIVGSVVFLYCIQNYFISHGVI